MNKRDIKTMIDRLNNLIHSDHSDEDYDNFVIESAISILENLGNAYHALQLENAKLKKDILQLEAMIED